MNVTDKELLLRDLSARLPYGVILQLDNSVIRLEDINYEDGECTIWSKGWDYPLDEIKPYLRPMSSMTEKERIEYAKFLEDINSYAYSIDCVPQIDWLNEHHFDYRGLINKGLALEAPKGMYN